MVKKVDEAGGGGPWPVKSAQRGGAVVNVIAARVKIMFGRYAPHVALLPPPRFAGVSHESYKCRTISSS